MCLTGLAGLSYSQGSTHVSLVSCGLGGSVTPLTAGAGRPLAGSAPPLFFGAGLALARKPGGGGKAPAGGPGNGGSSHCRRAVGGGVERGGHSPALGGGGSSRLSSSRFKPAFFGGGFPGAPETWRGPSSLPHAGSGVLHAAKVGPRRPGLMPGKQPRQAPRFLPPPPPPLNLGNTFPGATTPAKFNIPSSPASAVRTVVFP